MVAEQPHRPGQMLEHGQGQLRVALKGGVPLGPASRVLGELSALGLLALGYRTVTVLDRAGLEALVFEL